MSFVLFVVRDLCGCGADLCAGKGYFIEISNLRYYKTIIHGLQGTKCQFQNILIRDTHLKLADLGSCRGTHSKPPYTEYIATRWYRPPECLLCDGMYSLKMDLWGAGCVLFEVVSKVPLFPGSNEVDQLYRIHGVVGTPGGRVLKRMVGYVCVGVQE